MLMNTQQQHLNFNSHTTSPNFSLIYCRCPPNVIPMLRHCALPTFFSTRREKVEVRNWANATFSKKKFYHFFQKMGAINLPKVAIILTTTISKQHMHWTELEVHTYFVGTQTYVTLCCLPQAQFPKCTLLLSVTYVRQRGLYYVEETFFTKGQKSQEKAKKQAYTCAVDLKQGLGRDKKISSSIGIWGKQVN